MWARQQEWRSWDFYVLRMVLHNLKQHYWNASSVVSVDQY